MTFVLVEEVVDHAGWAVHRYQDPAITEVYVLHAATGGPGSRQNLFLGGFVKWTLKQGVSSFHDYMCSCLGLEYKENLSSAIRNKVASLGIEIRGLGDFPNVTKNEWGELEPIKDKIKTLRIDRGTFRTDRQCEAEAEIVVIGLVEQIIFLSQSGVLNALLKNDRLTWKPEAMYRFLALFSDVPVGDDLLYECMTQDFFNAGFNIIDRDAVEQYAAPIIRQSRMMFEKEKTKYEQVLGEKRSLELRSEFERVPDLEKPFYSLQFAYHVATQEAAKRVAAELGAKQVVAKKELTNQERIEYERLKNKKAEKRRKAELKRIHSKSKAKRGRARK
jgi:hypothetical protein